MLTEKQIKAATAWWADVLFNPKFDNEDRAGISRSNAPWKTTMWFKDVGAQVAYVYGSDVVSLVLEE